MSLTVGGRHMPTNPDDAGWVQWTLTTVILAIGVVGGGAWRHLQGQINRLSREQADVVDDAREVTTKGAKDLWQAVERIREMIELDRREAAADRTRIAERMVSRDEFDRRMDRIDVVLSSLAKRD